MSAPDPWEVHLGPLLRARDPAAARAALLGEGLPIELAEAVRALDPDGLRVLGLLVARLRYDRLLQRSQKQRAAFEADPAGWTDAFRDWHAATPAVPGDEEGP